MSDVGEDELVLVDDTDGANDAASAVEAALTPDSNITEDQEITSLGSDAAPFDEELYEPQERALDNARVEKPEPNEVSEDLQPDEPKPIDTEVNAAAPETVEMDGVLPDKPKPNKAELSDPEPVDTELLDAQSVDAKSVDAQSEPNEAELSEPELVGTEPEPDDTESNEPEPNDAEPIDTELADTEPEGPEPVDADLSEPLPNDAEPVDADPVGTEPEDIEPGDPELSAAESTDTDLEDTESIETAPEDTEPVDTALEDTALEDTALDDTEPVDEELVNPEPDQSDVDVEPSEATAGDHAGTVTNAQQWLDEADASGGLTGAVNQTSDEIDPDDTSMSDTDTQSDNQESDVDDNPSVVQSATLDADKTDDAADLEDSDLKAESEPDSESASDESQSTRTEAESTVDSGSTTSTSESTETVEYELETLKSDVDTTGAAEADGDAGPSTNTGSSADAADAKVAAKIDTESDNKVDDGTVTVRPGATPSVDPAPTQELAVVKADSTTAPSTTNKTATAQRWPRIAKVVVFGLIAAYGLLTAVWGIDVLRSRNTVREGVTIANIDVSGMSEGRLDGVLDTLNQELVGSTVEVRVGDDSIETTAGSLGSSIDQERVVADAMSAGRGGFFATQPIRWLTNRGDQKTIAVQYQFDETKTRTAAENSLIPQLLQPVEPAMVLEGSELEVTPGAEGVTIDPDQLVSYLPAAIYARAPYRIDLTARQAEPKIETQVVESAAGDANFWTSEAITIQILDDAEIVEPELIRSWIVFDAETDVGWRLDEDMALADLKPMFPTLGSEDQQAKFEIVDDAPVIIPASETVVCCDAGLAERITKTLQEPPQQGAPSNFGFNSSDDDVEATNEDDEDEEEPPTRKAILAPMIVGFDEGIAELESLGVIEKVSTFTTPHKCCQNRVKNIQRFAEIMQGQIIRPGEELSLNETVGRRTTDNGFFSDGAIVNGELKKVVGGGVSQYATTFLNASFFSGIDILEYRSHSRYISRYPEGREATLDYTSIDLRVLNDTDYGILVWNEWDDTSITVSFYSTEHVEVEALPIKTAWNGQCRTVTTERVVTYQDGSTKEDSVFAYYFPGFNRDCSGNLINVPDEDTP